MDKFTCNVASFSFRLRGRDDKKKNETMYEETYELLRDLFDCTWKSSCVDSLTKIEAIAKTYPGLILIHKRQVRDFLFWGDDIPYAFLEFLPIVLDVCQRFCAVVDQLEKNVSTTRVMDRCFELKQWYRMKSKPFNFNYPDVGNAAHFITTAAAYNLRYALTDYQQSSEDAQPKLADRGDESDKE